MRGTNSSTHVIHFMRRLAGLSGIAAVVLAVMSLLVFGSLNPDFDFVNDYISKLGANGQPLALWWNLVGFLCVGLLMSCFGWCYGVAIQDRLVGVLLTCFGLGLCATAIPVELDDGDSALSKAHVVAICLGLGTWFFALARMAQLPRLGKFVHYTANISAGCLLIPFVGQIAQFWSMPVTHRIVFAVVFIWLGTNSTRLLTQKTEPIFASAGDET